MSIYKVVLCIASLVWLRSLLLDVLGAVDIWLWESSGWQAPNGGASTLQQCASQVTSCTLPGPDPRSTLNLLAAGITLPGQKLMGEVPGKQLNKLLGIYIRFFQMLSPRDWFSTVQEAFISGVRAVFHPIDIRLEIMKKNTKSSTEQTKQVNNIIRKKRFQWPMNIRKYR
jgi:hypothetical protein